MPVVFPNIILLPRQFQMTVPSKHHMISVSVFFTVSLCSSIQNYQNSKTITVIPTQNPEHQPICLTESQDFVSHASNKLQRPIEKPKRFSLGLEKSQEINELL